MCVRVRSNDLTPDSLQQQVKRGNYEVYVWKKALEPTKSLSPAAIHDWKVRDGALQHVLMTKDPAPRGLPELTVCHCNISTCHRADYTCTTNNNMSPSRLHLYNQQQHVTEPTTPIQPTTTCHRADYTSTTNNNMSLSRLHLYNQQQHVTEPTTHCTTNNNMSLSRLHLYNQQHVTEPTTPVQPTTTCH